MSSSTGEPSTTERPIDPLPRLLICVDRVHNLPTAFLGFARSGYRGGNHVLVSDTAADIGGLDTYLSPWWPKEEPVTWPADLAEMTKQLPRQLAQAGGVWS